jgi:hypothetical protein
VPGLQGKRLSVEANMACLPLLVRGPTAENAGWAYYNPTFSTSGSNAFPFSWRASLTAHYITGRKHAVFAGLHYYNTGMKMTAYTLPLLPTPYEGIDFMDRHNLFMNMNTTAIELGSEKNTGQAMLAPLGSYFRVSLLYYMMNAKIVDKYTIYPAGNSLGNRPLGLDAVQTWDMGVGLEFGTRTVVAKNVTFNFGIRSNIALMWIFGESRTAPTYQNEYDTRGSNGNDSAITAAIKAGDAEASNQLMFQTEARKRNSQHELLMFNFGLSYYIK